MRSSDFLCKCEYKQSKFITKMDYKVRSHDLGNLLRSYYYVKKVLQVVRSVINIIVKERVYSVFKNKVHIILVQRDAWYKTWYMCGVSYTILMLGNSCTPQYYYWKMHSLIHGCCVVCDKPKKMTQRNSCTTQPKQIFTLLLMTKTFALFLELCAQL
jgi:hypothetical protein